jgi:hypothetical protein
MHGKAWHLGLLLSPVSLFGGSQSLRSTRTSTVVLICHWLSLGTGNGGFGRLGHKVQKDEFKPKPLEEFRGRISVAADAQVACSATATFCTIVGGQLFAWGKWKVSGDNTMYPKVPICLSVCHACLPLPASRSGFGVDPTMHAM